jgi:hypothetical protein
MPSRDAKSPPAPKAQIYDGEGDRLMGNLDAFDRVIVLPDPDTERHPTAQRRIRVMWGQSLLADLLDGRYRTLVCGVNAKDNSRGIITQIAASLPTSQWNDAAITSHASRFVQPSSVTVMKFDMDAVEVLALLRPRDHDVLTVDDLATGFKIISEMIRRKPQRMPSACVSFLGARANKLIGADEREPSLETVLRTMYEAGYSGDLYPSPQLWRTASVGVYAHYPFPKGIDAMREGGD